jgi:hypothetical protein
MASSINASTSGAGGVITTADNTGILNLQTASTTAVTVDASQNVGIGTTSPAAIASGHTVVDISAASGKSANIYLHGNGTSGNSTGLQIQSSTGDCGLYQLDNAPMVFATNNANRMRITAGGQVIIGATTGNDTTRLGVVSSTSGVNTNTSAITSTSGTRYHWTFQDGASSTERGSITTNGSATAYNTSSDYRLKENILPMTGALATVQALKPVTYTWKESGDNSQGFIAHELQAVVPDCVTGEKDAVETYTDEEGKEQTRPKYQSIDTSFLVATLTAAIQEQQTIINDLKARVTALEAK